MKAIFGIIFNGGVFRKMSIEVLSIIVLISMFIIASALPINLGVFGFVAAFIVGNLIGGLGMEEVFGGFPASLFVILAGVTYLFAIAQNNGTIDLITHAGLRLVRGNSGLVPWIMFGLSTLLTSVGTHGIASVAVFAPIALRLAAQYNINSLMMGIMVTQGAFAGSYSPINPVGVIVNGVLQSRDLPGSPGLIYLNTLIFSIVFSLIIFVVFGGVRLLKKQTNHDTAHISHLAATLEENTEMQGSKLTWYKGITLTGIALMVILALVFHIDIGFAAFTVGLVLALISPKKQSRVLASMPWSVILMISGIVTYVGVMEKIGTVEFLTDLIEKVGNPITAALAASYIGGVISAFASTTGILAAILPMAAPILQDPTISAIGVITAICIASAIVDLSPFSTNGALLLANVQGVKERVFFKHLLIFSIVIIATAPGIAWLVFVLIGIP
jgi:di/tricarboxylate transporter